MKRRYRVHEVGQRDRRTVQRLTVEQDSSGQRGRIDRLKTSADHDVLVESRDAHFIDFFQKVIGHVRVFRPVDLFGNDVSGKRLSVVFGQCRGSFRRRNAVGVRQNRAVERVKVEFQRNFVEVRRSHFVHQ